MAALAALATQPSAIERLLVTKTRSDSGKYVVKLFLGGKPTEVTVDDWLPVLGDKPAFCCSKDESGELWPSLLEKAWVKAHGSCKSDAFSICRAARLANPERITM